MKKIKEIATGSFAVVDEVELPSGERVARKTFSPSPAVLQRTSKEVLQKRFQREVLVQKDLPSDLFIPIYDYKMDGDEWWFTMPLCRRNYDDQIAEDRANGTVNRDSLSDILNSLDFLHGIGLTHRDLKPANILFHDGHWKLGDFGLVSPHEAGDKPLSSTVGGWGTEEYAAPEQSFGFRFVDGRADIYAFGCILHDIFSGEKRVPYSEHTCRNEMGLVIERCTKRKREDRFGSISTLRSSVLSILARVRDFEPSKEAGQWSASLAAVDKWDVEMLRQFTQYVSASREDMDLWTVFSVLDEDVMKTMVGIDPDYADTIFVCLSDWAKSRSFDFDFCDGLASNLSMIAETASVNAAASAIMALARIAARHNRYYCMRVLFRICGESMNHKLAMRVGFEIGVENAKSDFLACVEDEYERTLDSLHPAVAAALR
jgi:serine/threonine protein kinase